MLMEQIRDNCGDSMSRTRDQNGDDPTTQLNDRGRLTIPKEVRDALQLDAGDEFDVVIEGGDIHLERKLPELTTVKSGKSEDEWKESNAFPDAGEATFGGTN